MAANGWMHAKLTTDGYAHNTPIRAHNTSNTQLTTAGCVHAHNWHNSWMCTCSQLTQSHTPCSQLTHNRAHNSMMWAGQCSILRSGMSNSCWAQHCYWIPMVIRDPMKVRLLTWNSDAHDHNVNEAFYHIPRIRSKTPTIRFHGLGRFEWNQGRWGINQFPSQNAHICETFSENRSNGPHRGP